MRQRLDTKYRCVCITQIQMFVFETSYTLGYEPVRLPAYLTQNTAIMCFDRRKLAGGKYHTLYSDNLCSFRCITYHIYLTVYASSQNHFELLTLKMFKKWQTFMVEEVDRPVTFRGGGTSDQLNLLERCFSLSINVYEKVDKDVVIPVYRSQHSYNNEFVSNFHKGHLSYVTDFKHYTKKHSL